jgi:GyrI-like small molecule binding domain
MKIVIIISAILFIFLFSFYVYYGGLKRIRPVITLAGGETIAYRDVRGNYKQSGPVSDDVYNQLMEKLDVETFRGFGIYYDDPQKVEEENLRSEVGCIIEKQDLDKIDRIREYFQVKAIPEKKYLTVEFPYRNPLSSLMGVFKVHPVLKKEAIKENPSFTGSVMEIWDVPRKKILYRKEIY